ncbi:MAG: hypothetical protein M0P77_10280 [Firmicutes bacterium]|nr:hypothetical protein [Bacillota bacterium]
MATEVTMTKMSAINTATKLNVKAAAIDTANGTETFEFAPKGVRVLLGIENGSTDKLTYELSAGDMWAGKGLTGDFSTVETKVLRLDTANFKDDEGNITLKLTPASGKKLLTDHGAKVFVIE